MNGKFKENLEKIVKKNRACYNNIIKEKIISLILGMALNCETYVC